MLLLPLPLFPQLLLPLLLHTLPGRLHCLLPKQDLLALLGSLGLQALLLLLLLVGRLDWGTGLTVLLRRWRRLLLLMLFWVHLGVLVRVGTLVFEWR